MSLRYEVEATIDAAPAAVWEILVDTGKWPEWDPFCERIEGEVALGAKLKAFTKLQPGRGFGLKVTELTPNRRMIWSGGMPLGLFTGVRTYALEEKDGRTRFSMSEEFGGPMLFMIRGSIPDMNEAFQAFADGLKKRAESA